MSTVPPFPVRLVGRAAPSAVKSWDRLTRPTSGPRPFDPSAVADLPAPARRWLTRSIAPGTPLSRTVVLDMQGHFRLGRWLPMRAVQVLSPPAGLVWLARIGWGPLSFRGFDRYEEERGEMQWRLPGQVPVMHAGGADVDRSAAGRLAGEAVWTPAAFLDPRVTWRAGGDDTVTAEWALGPHRVSTELRVDAGGRLLAVSIRRWGKPGGDPWGEYPFGGAVAEEKAFGGMRIPTRMTVGWFYGTKRAARGEFFRLNVTRAQFL
jgi:hypothetical protein